MRVRKDGKKIHISLTASFIKDEAGRIIGASTIARDITARKKMGEELKQKTSNFENLFDVSMDREKEMIKLKKEINRLSKKLGIKKPYEGDV